MITNDELQNEIEARREVVDVLVRNDFAYKDAAEKSTLRGFKVHSKMVADILRKLAEQQVAIVQDLRKKLKESQQVKPAESMLAGKSARVDFILDPKPIKRGRGRPRKVL